MKSNKEIQKLKIALTTDCVLACRHCRVDKAAGLTVGFADAVKAVDLLISSPGGAKRLELYGGEPFLKFALLKKIILYAARRAVCAKKKLSLSVASNGLVLDEKRLAFLRRNGVNLSISVSGSRRSHDLCRVYPDGTGSYLRLQEKLRLILSRLPPADVVALECVAPSGAGRLFSDLKGLAAAGFTVANVECVHGMPWSAAAIKALRKSLAAYSAWLPGEIEKGRFIVPEPFLEFFRVSAAGPSLACPLYRDLELYPDGTYSFYPFAFIDYSAHRKAVSIGSARAGLDGRYAACRPGGPRCRGCVREYYTIGGLSSGTAAYTARTEELKRAFLAIMRRSRGEAAFALYARGLAELKDREYSRPGGRR